MVAALCVTAFALPLGGAQAPRAAIPATTLPLRLTGVLFDDTNPEKAAALVECLAQPVRRGVFGVGDRPCDLAEIKEIRPELIVIRNIAADRVEVLALPGPAGGSSLRARSAPTVGEAAADPPPLVVPRETVQAALANLPEVLSSARAVPRYQTTGQTHTIAGFEVTEVRPSGAAERLGLRRGDIILDVNGQVLDGMPTVMRLFGELPSISRVTIGVLRDGRRLAVSFDTK